MNDRPLTQKQIAILDCVRRGKDGDFLDLDQLLEEVPYVTTKQSMQFSIRALEKRRLIEKLPLEKRRERLRVRYRITKLGRAAMDPFEDVVHIF